MLSITQLWLDGGRLTQAPRSQITDTQNPMFGWTAVSDTDGDGQTACRVTVADADGSLLWDSGWQQQAAQRLTYAGAPLPVGQPLSVQVGLRSAGGEETFSARQTFYNGQRPQWEGCWLVPTQYRSRAVNQYRRRFAVKGPIRNACLYVAGLGYHKVWLNGRALDDAVLDPAHANYAKTVYYTVLPGLETQLQADGTENELVVQVADGWRHNDSAFVEQATGGRKIEFAGQPMLSAVLEWDGPEGRQRLVTDADWQWRYDPIVESNLFDGETYNAAALLPENEAEWAPVACTDGPGGEMRPMTIAPIREQETYPAIDIFEPVKGVFVADFGQNIAGVLRFTLPEGLRRGQKITVSFMEFLDEDGTLYRAPLRGAKQTDTYIAAGSSDAELKVWQPQFTYHGFRYAEIRGLECVQRSQLTAVALYTDVASGSSFRCGNALINQIHRNAVQTEKANIHSILTDCPQRDERMGWMNDATVRFEETPYNFHIGRLFAKVVRDIRNEQRPNGAFTCCAPFVFGALPADPVCSSYLVAGAQALLYTGNIAVIAQAFDGFAAWEDFLLSQSKDYIVQYSYYGDWAAPAYACQSDESAVSAVTPGLLMSTGYSYFNCRTLAQLAHRLGRAADEQKYAVLAQRVKEAFLAEWWHPDTALVATGSQGAQAFALWLELLPQREAVRAAAQLHNDLVQKEYRFTTGNLCTRYMLDMLAKYGYVEDVWQLLNSTQYPSFGYMIQNEATTVWERFELKKNPDMNSHNHPMYGAVDAWFYRWLCGIRPTAEGFDEVEIRPCYPQGLLSAQAVVDTVHGDVGVRWVKRYGQLHLYVHLPFGMHGTVWLPDGPATVGSGSHQYHWALQE